MADWADEDEEEELEEWAPELFEDGELGAYGPSGAQGASRRRGQQRVGQRDAWDQPPHPVNLSRAPAFIPASRVNAPDQLAHPSSGQPGQASHSLAQAPASAGDEDWDTPELSVQMQPNPPAIAAEVVDATAPQNGSSWAGAWIGGAVAEQAQGAAGDEDDWYDNEDDDDDLVAFLDMFERS